MDKSELEERTKSFAVRIIRFVGEFNSVDIGRAIGNQLLKAGTSIGANYREANRAVSRRDFTYRISIAEKEASETMYWLEICLETSLGPRQTGEELLAESRELLAIFTSIGRSMRSGARSIDGKPRGRVSTTTEPGYGRSPLDMDVNNLIPTELNAEHEE
jgi:four helix bundle protein